MLKGPAHFKITRKINSADIIRTCQNYTHAKEYPCRIERWCAYGTHAASGSTALYATHQEPVDVRLFSAASYAAPGKRPAKIGQ